MSGGGVNEVRSASCPTMLGTRLCSKLHSPPIMVSNATGSLRKHWRMYEKSMEEEAEEELSKCMHCAAVDKSDN
jgi:hypothetical protein